MELKDVLGEIEADGANLVHERLLEWALTPPLWHADAVGGVHTIKPLEIWFADEARIGQKNKITRRWAQRGTRPSAPKDQRTASAYIFGAICPAHGKGAGLVLPRCIYEVDFLGFSYGFRPGRGAHDALDALAVGITSTKVSHILDADIRSFFDAVSQEWLLRFLNHRIGDPRILRLIRKWLNAGVLEDGVVSVGETGTGQGSVISPLLANVYLHHVFDLWAERWRRREARGDMIIVRYADDIVVGFEHEADARRFRDAMRARLEAFALTLHPDKTRLIAFGRFAADRRAQRGLGQPETFCVLGFTHICGRSRRGTFQLQRKSRTDRMRATLRRVKDALRRRMHQPIPVQGRWLTQVVSGYFAYHAVPTNRRALMAFRHHVTDLWRRTLRRRSQKDRLTWARMAKLADAWLPRPHILHPWPSERFAVRHPRWEPSARIGPARISAGGAQ